MTTERVIEVTMSNFDIIKTDILVIGGGGAGCRAAIESALQGCQVILASKFPVGKSGATLFAESFYAAPLVDAEPPDNFEYYFQDTVQGGSMLCDQTLALKLVNDGWSRVLDLQRYGIKFRQKEDGKLLQMKSPGHTYPRGLAPLGGGFGIMRGLQGELKKHRQIKLLEDVMVYKVLANVGTVAGAMGFDIRKGEPLLIEAKSVIIATGGYSALWANNDGPCDSTGDGMAMAYHVGADLVDMEMMLFYPTVAIYPLSIYGVLIPHEILSEQVRAKLLNGRFEEFLPKKIPTREAMNYLIYKEVAKGNGTPHGGVYLDATRSSLSRDEVTNKLMTFLPEKYKYLLEYNIDIAREPIEVAPMAHYALGGIKINSDCGTRVLGLYCAGEVEGNVHGANRLGGNALSETQVFGAKAGEMATIWARDHDYVDTKMEEVKDEVKRIGSLLSVPKASPINPSQLKLNLQSLMWNYVGPEREEKKLKLAIQEIERMKAEDINRMAISPVREFNLQWLDALEVPHMLDLSEIIARAALMRNETRGHHVRVDYPEKDDKNWLRHIVVRKEGGRMKLWTEPVETVVSTNAKAILK
jgi:fumarate reductase (CoM/CoB) subunit A